MANPPETGTPYNAEAFSRAGVLDVWRNYSDRLSWGKGQCLAILDDGCDLATPEWQSSLPWGPKVIASYNSIDGNTDPTPVPPGYHGTSVGFPSVMNHEGTLGVACNADVAQVRCVSIVHLVQDESLTIADALQWVIDHRERLNITAVNLSPLDDLAHAEPVATPIDEKLAVLRTAGVWVSAPCGNNGHTDGISWPACQPGCFGIGATRQNADTVYLDRFSNTDLLVPAAATSSSNAIAAAASMITREAIDKADYPWKNRAASLPEAILDIFTETGIPVSDPETGLSYRRLNLLAAIKHVYSSGRGIQ